MADFDPMDRLPGGSDCLGYLSSRKAGFGAELSEAMRQRVRCSIAERIEFFEEFGSAHAALASAWDDERLTTLSRRETICSTKMAAGPLSGGPASSQRATVDWWTPKRRANIAWLSPSLARAVLMFSAVTMTTIYA